MRTVMLSQSGRGADRGYTGGTRIRLGSGHSRSGFQTCALPTSRRSSVNRRRNMTPSNSVASRVDADLNLRKPPIPLLPSHLWLEWGGVKVGRRFTRKKAAPSAVAPVLDGEIPCRG